MKIWPTGQGTEEAPSEPCARDLLCTGETTAPMAVGNGGESGRPVTLCFQDRHLWGWQCSWCGAIESGFTAEHHARVIGNEHALAHRPDLDGAQTLGGA